MEVWGNHFGDCNMMGCEDDREGKVLGLGGHGGGNTAGGCGAASAVPWSPKSKINTLDCALQWTAFGDSNSSFLSFCLQSFSLLLFSSYVFPLPSSRISLVPPPSILSLHLLSCISPLSSFCPILCYLSLPVSSLSPLLSLPNTDLSPLSCHLH